MPSVAPCGAPPRAVAAVLDRGAEPAERLFSGRQLVSGHHPGLAEAGRRSRTVATALVALAEGEQQVDAAAAQQLPTLLDLRGIAVEGAVVQIVAAVQGAGALEVLERELRIGGRAGLGHRPFEGGHVAPGDDGLAEAHNADREMFGFPRLQRLVARPGTGETMIASLLTELDQFMSGEHDDDITLLGLTRATAPAGDDRLQV